MMMSMASVVLDSVSQCTQFTINAIDSSLEACSLDIKARKVFWAVLSTGVFYVAHSNLEGLVNEVDIFSGGKALITGMAAGYLTSELVKQYLHLDTLARAENRE